MCVLIVDDDQEVAEALCAVLLLEGFESRFADCIRCLQMIDAWIPHVIVLDIEMPIMDGFKVSQALRRRTHLTTAAVIAHTSLAEADVIEHGSAAGMDAYCRKGNAPTVLLELIRQVAPLDVS
ncbi:response regulator [Caballeronia zhejiangensis]|uniref:response regulator n=1 Tax=Caballeronia zhejiangensis TaxID=871203 RepID=UPI001FD57BAD|nr:response regulator [Caballeronia zhejiangensis]